MQDPSGADLGWQRTDTTLAAGLHTIEFIYDCEDVYARHADGAFVLTDLILVEADQVQMPVEEMPVAYRTRAYGFKEFQHQAIAAYDIQSSRNDADGAGGTKRSHFEFILTRKNHGAASSRGFEARAEAVDSADRIVEFSRGQRYEPVDLDFDGTKIKQAGGSGQYMIDLFYGCGRDGPREYLSDAAMSAEYMASDFE